MCFTNPNLCSGSGLLRPKASLFRWDLVYHGDSSMNRPVILNYHIHVGAFWHHLCRALLRLSLFLVLTRNNKCPLLSPSAITLCTYWFWLNSEHTVSCHGGCLGDNSEAFLTTIERLFNYFCSKISICVNVFRKKVSVISHHWHKDHNVFVAFGGFTKRAFQ